MTNWLESTCQWMKVYVCLPPLLLELELVLVLVNCSRCSPYTWRNQLGPGKVLGLGPVQVLVALPLTHQAQLATTVTAQDKPTAF